MKRLFIIPVFLIILDVSSAAGQVPGKGGTAPQLMTGNLIDSLVVNIRRTYIFPDQTAKIGTYLKTLLKKGNYRGITDPESLAATVSQDLRKISNDGHLRIFYRPEVPTEKRTLKVTEDEQRQRKDALQRAVENNFSFKKVEILPGNLGYLRFDNFEPFVKEAKPMLQGVFQFLKSTKAVIIDMRYNHGGSPEMAMQIESYFFSQRTHMLNVIIPAENVTRELYADPVNTDSISLAMPVYILTAQNTFSAPEGFAYDMQSSGRATIVGENTGGGANMLPPPFYIGQGFWADIPGARPYSMFTKTNWEGIGVKPDIEITKELALLKAQDHYFTNQINSTSNHWEKNKAKWYLDELKVLYPTNKSTENYLQQFTGNFEGGLIFYLNEGKLYCKNGEMNNSIMELKPISEALFTYDENMHVLFEKDSNGKFNKLKLIASWGETRDKRKK